MSVYDRIWDRKLMGVQTDPLSDPGSRWAAASGLVPIGNRLLDIGVGDGGFAECMKPRVSEVFGIDVSPIAVQSARRRGIEAFVCDLDREASPFPDRHFDVITCLDVIEHVLDPRKLLLEISRLATPGGVVVVSTVNIRCVKYLHSVVLRGRFPRTSGDEEAYDGGHLHYFTTGDLRALLSGVGLVTTHAQGMIASRSLGFLRPWAACGPVREFLSAGIVVRARRAGALT
ncbi:MAG: class I SAM-dependent methyltransferase [Chloroflexota bacterium]|nr:MAG: class I SAM-dependent methyltransferase [Chloroflexota bacterium]